MPTYDVLPAFWTGFDRLTPAQQARFRRAITRFAIELLEIERGDRMYPSPGLIKKLQGHPDLWEFRWAHNGRATFAWDTAVRPDKHHIVWHQIGTHGILP
ncbi:MAG: hypothetical protein OXI96_00810 [Acidimicrobiaceae bacterium]|nr:hypothetical protein [Acidimicrobiaceae bacterium]